MPYRTILVCFSGEADAGQLSRAAEQIGTRHDAHVIGIYVVPPIRVVPAVGVHIPPAVLEEQTDLHRQVAARIEASFSDAMKKAGIGYEWRTVETNDPILSRAVTRHGRMCDLVIVAQPTSGDDPLDLQALTAEILLDCGRPVLMVPRSGKVKTVGNHVFLAWNGERESARAAFDALPLMVEAKDVRVHWINPGEEAGGDRGVPGAELATTLARHGVTVEAGHSVCKDMSVGDEILSRLADHGCDLLVMGGYGHSRLREMIFGGATRHILNHMTVPVLMSH